MAQTVPACGLQRGERNYRLATVAVLAAGLAVFNGLYVTQAMLPALVDAFDTTPTVAALTVSVATGMLAICVVPASILSERFGRNRVLIISAIAASLIGLTLPLAQTIHQLIALRLLHGAFIAGTPAVAMAWLAEELDHRFLARAMGVYVAGNSVGGLTGRLLPDAARSHRLARSNLLCIPPSSRLRHHRGAHPAAPAVLPAEGPAVSRRIRIHGHTLENAIAGGHVSHRFSRHGRVRFFV